MNISKYKNYMLLHFTVLIWGFTAILGKLITMNATALVWYRMLLAALSILIYLKIIRIPLKVSKKLLWQYAGVGLIIAAHWISFYASIKVGNISVAVVCLSSATFFTALIEPIVYKRKIILYELMFGLLVIAGLYMIFNIQHGYSMGMLYGTLAGFFASLFTTFNGKLVKDNDPVTLSFYEISGGFIGITLYFLFSGQLTLHLLQPSLSDFFYLTLLSTICTAFAFIASSYVMKEISPFTMVLSVNLEPVYSIILAYFIFGESERMSMNFYIGATSILFIIIINAILKSRKRKKVVVPNFME